MAKLACDNVRDELCKINNIQNNSKVQIRVRNKNDLVKLVEKIVTNPVNAVALFSKDVGQMLILKSEVMLQHSLSTGVVFVNSVLMSRDARICQKQLVDLMVVEMYFKEAYNYDKRHKCEIIADTAIETAKTVIKRLYSPRFLNNFIFDGYTPRIDDGVRSMLERQAFDVRYSFVKSDSSISIARKRYELELGNRRDFFLMSSAERRIQNDKSDARAVGILNRSHKTKALKEAPYSPDDNVITELYQGAFAKLTLRNRIRKFVNLKARNRDILICPTKNLSVKRQYATVDALTKHKYIYNYFDDVAPKNVKNSQDKSDYYLEQEIKMYQYMWSTKEPIYCQDNKLYFPDGTELDIPPQTPVHHFLHKVNTTYGSLFGFTPDDMRGGRNWLYDSVRRAYTDEGVAEYRLAMISAKLKGKI
ncbi:hypothetical protein J6A31_07570 [bacterium]|nr:hypothetical protein [bacterium]